LAKPKLPGWARVTQAISGGEQIPLCPKKRGPTSVCYKQRASRFQEARNLPGPLSAPGYTTLTAASEQLLSTGGQRVNRGRRHICFCPHSLRQSLFSGNIFPQGVPHADSFLERRRPTLKEGTYTTVRLAQRSTLLTPKRGSR